MGHKSIYRSHLGEEKVTKKYAELLRHWPVEKQADFVETPQGKTHVIVSGSGDNPPLVLLHGACDNSLMWLKQVQSYLHSFQVYVIDIIGEANPSAQQRPPLGSGNYVDWLEAILAHYNIQQVALCGFDFGAWICLRFAARWPDKITKLALLSPSGIVGGKKGLMLKRLLLTLVSGTFGRRWLLSSLLQRNLDTNQQELNALIIRHFKPRSWSLPNALKPPLPPLYCPVLLILGGKDRFYDTDKVLLALAKQIPQLELILRPKEGHFLEDYTRELDRFLVTEFAPE